MGNDNVNFQPPESIKLTYPCIIYTLNSDQPSYANNQIYLNKNRYTISLISRTPDIDIFDDVRALPLCSFDRTYVVNNLYHYVFTLYF